MPRSSALPSWYGKEDLELTPHQKEIVRAHHREKRLPPYMRSKKRDVRDLRDGYLGQMMLSKEMDPFEDQLPALKYLAMIAQRDAARVEMRKIVKELESKVSKEDRAWAKGVAKELFAFSIQEARRERARKG